MLPSFFVFWNIVWSPADAAQEELSVHWHWVGLAIVFAPSEAASALRALVEGDRERERERLAIEQKMYDTCG